jgi:hypothetical protein
MPGAETQVRLELDTDDPIQRWRYRCPRGHTAFEPTNHHWYCAECARSHDDVDPEFTELVDKRTGAVYERDDVRVIGYRAKTT